MRSLVTEADGRSSYRPGTVRKWADGPHVKKPDGSWEPIPDSHGAAPASGPPSPRASSGVQPGAAQTPSGASPNAGTEPPAAPGPAPAAQASKYSDDPNAYNAALAKMMGKLKKDVGATGVNQNYKGTGKQSHRRQVFVRLPDHERGGPDVWLDSGHVKVGGVIGTPKGIPNQRSYGDDPPEKVYAWIRDTLKAINDHEKAKWAALAKDAAPKAEALSEMRRITRHLDARLGGTELVE